MSLEMRNSRPRIRLLIVLMLAVATGVTVIQLNNSSDNASTSKIRNIAGGREVSAIAELPYQVSILSANPDLAKTNLGNKNAWGWSICGGSLIAQQWVLTADHCIQRNSNYGIEPQYIWIGASSTTYTKALLSPLYVKAAYPARDARYKKPDLMLLELTEPLNIDLGKTVALPVDVDTTTWPLQGSIATLSGWGKTGVGTDSSEVLKTVESIIGDTPTSTEPCIGGGFYSLYASFHEICVPGGTQNERIGACQGDSGGPLTVEVDGKPVLAGVASWAFNASCDGLLPVVYARVASHLTWVVPGAVKDINFQSGANGVLASWSPADRIPAVPIKDYVIQRREKGAANFSTINDGVSTAAS
ncbi:MAG: serine protease, partial [Actinomycetota bacterium]